MTMTALDLVHEQIAKLVKDGDVCIDATAGRGYDTAFLCDLVGKTGKVIAFDIQESAIDSTQKLLEEKGFDNAQLVLGSHDTMADYADNESVSAIMFNLGYLPGGNHAIYTHAPSTIKAIENGLELLKHGGLMSVSIYYGGDSGYEEKDALLPFLKTLDDKKYQVLMTTFYNWKKDPPIPVFIFKY